MDFEQDTMHNHILLWNLVDLSSAGSHRFHEISTYKYYQQIITKASTGTTLYSSSADEYSDNRFAESAAFRDVRVTVTSKGNKHSTL